MESRYVVWVFVFVVALICDLYRQALGKLILEDGTQLTTVSVKDIMNTNDFVGYQKGSSVPMILQQLNIHESKLKAYNSLEEYDEALSKGSKNGGVSAIFDEIPYIKLLINKYCGKYRSIGPVYKTEGFGFVFQKGDPLAPEVSRELLPMMEGTKYAQIESKWLESNGKCPDPPPEGDVLSSTITFPKITGLFVFIGIFLGSSLLLHLAATHYNLSTNWVSRTLWDILPITQAGNAAPRPALQVAEIALPPLPRERVRRHA